MQYICLFMNSTLVFPICLLSTVITWHYDPGRHLSLFNAADEIVSQSEHYLTGDSQLDLIYQWYCLGIIRNILTSLVLHHPTTYGLIWYLPNSE